MTTLNQFVTAVSGVTLASATRTFAYPPETINTADMPAQWVGLPQGDSPDIISAVNIRNKTRTVDLIVAVSPYGQDTQKQRFDTAVTVMDEIETALDALTTMNFMSYTMRMTTEVQAGQLGYWAVVATVTGRDNT